MEVLSPQSEATQLTKCDVKKCCQRYFKDHFDENIRIIAFEKSNISSEPSGFLGEHQFLHVLAERSSADGTVKHKLKFFLKCVPEDVLSHKEYIEEFGVFQKEVYVYTQIIPRLTSINAALGSFSPKCYFAKHNMLVFENLSDQGYRMAAERDGLLDYDHLLVIVKTLANLHSASFVLEKQMTKPITEIYPNSLIENAYPTDCKATRHNYVMRSIAAITEILGAIPKYKNSPKWSYIVEEFPKQMKRIFEFVKTSEKFRNAICHGDLWANNVMFRYELDAATQREKVVDSRIVDFQLARIAPPLIDVITILTIPTSRKFREENLETLTNEYYKCLESNLSLHNMCLNDIITPAELRETVDYYRLTGLIESCLFSHMTMLPTDVTSNFLNNSDEFADFVNNRRGELCLIAFANDQIYRERMTDMISEIVDEYVLKSNPLSN